MSALHRKLGRELLQFAGQIIAIASVIAAGVLVLVITTSNYQSIADSRQQFYQQYRLADLFVYVNRVPQQVLQRVAQLPDVSTVEGRIETLARFEVEGFSDVIQGQLLSVPEHQALLNQLHLTQGQLPDSRRFDEVVISQTFADAHNLQLHDTIQAVINGRYQQLQVSGVALSPEFVYQMGPGDIMPDYERFGTFWMSERALAQAMDMEGAFNHISVGLQSAAYPPDTIAALNQLLTPYGSLGAMQRSELPSDMFLNEELDQLRVMSALLPTIFLGVAAFLLAVMMRRLITTQRQTIAVLKAFGYSNGDLMRHYSLFALMVTSIGLLVGVGISLWVAEPVARMYASYFYFPEFIFGLQPRSLLIAALLCLSAAFVGSYQAVADISRQAPAEAMRPPMPTHYHQGGQQWLRLTPVAQMIVRHIRRYPWRSMLSVTGIALSGSLILLGSYMFSAMDEMLDSHYQDSVRMDIEVQLHEPVHRIELANFRQLPGVLALEGFRQHAAIVRVQGREQRVQLLGVPTDSSMRPLALPPEGLVATRYLVDYLEVTPGDSIDIELPAARRIHQQRPLVNVVDEALGLGIYASIEYVNRILQEDTLINGVWLRSDPQYQNELQQALRDIPLVSGVTNVRQAHLNIQGYIDDTVLVVMAVLLLLAGSISFAVLYNNARIMLAERQRELATLRVLGFSRAEISIIIYAELAILALLAIPLAWLIGSLFSYALISGLSTELFRVPWSWATAPYLNTLLGVLAATFIAMLAVSRRLLTLDMMSSLKTE
ncbi:MAG: ABC transporter permease [Idiomarina sp.]|nr:ABC transporter permease [Idiomarina sp.]